MENPAYQVIYNVGLLDDIHNYFPALLYDQGRFQTLVQVFSYIRHQMDTRFNLYSYGASVSGGLRPNYHNEVPASNPEQTMQEDILASIASINLLLNVIQPTSSRSSIFGNSLPSSRVVRRPNIQGEAADIWAEFRAPVIVAPSQEIIAANSQIIIGSDLPSNTVCSICQDSIIASESCRRITSCQHVYHRACIDQWLTRSVVCPSCRHDIRNTIPRLQTPPSYTTPGPPLPPLPPLHPSLSSESSSSSSGTSQNSVGTDEL